MNFIENIGSKLRGANEALADAQKNWRDERLSKREQALSKREEAVAQQLAEIRRFSRQVGDED